VISYDAMMRRRSTFRKQGKHRPTQGKASRLSSSSGQTSANQPFTGVSIRVGWVERSDTHRPRTLASMGIASLNPTYRN
jgi:hypothetical protein